MLSSPAPGAASLQIRTLCILLTLLAGVSGASLGIDRSGPRALKQAVHASPSEGAPAGPEYVRLPAGPSRRHRTWLVPGGDRAWEHDFGPASPGGHLADEVHSPPAQGEPAAEDTPLVVSSGSWTNTASLGDSGPAAPSAAPSGARGSGKASFYVDPGDARSGNATASSAGHSSTCTSTSTSTSTSGYDVLGSSSDDDDDDDGE